MRERSLHLAKETLTALTGAQLHGVVGGASAGNTICVECLPTTDPGCPTRNLDTCNDVTFEMCPTMPIEGCV